MWKTCDWVSFLFFKQKTAYEMATGLEFRRVLFRSPGPRDRRSAPRGRRPGGSFRAGRPGWSGRSEERRVGKECRSRWSTYHQKKKLTRGTNVVEQRHFDEASIRNALLSDTA